MDSISGISSGNQIRRHNEARRADQSDDDAGAAGGAATAVSVPGADAAAPTDTVTQSPEIQADNRAQKAHHQKGHHHHGGGKPVTRSRAS